MCFRVVEAANDCASKLEPHLRESSWSSVSCHFTANANYGLGRFRDGLEISAHAPISSQSLCTGIALSHSELTVQFVVLSASQAYIAWKGMFSPEPLTEKRSWVLAICYIKSNNDLDAMPRSEYGAVWGGTGDCSIHELSRYGSVPEQVSY